MNNPTDDIRAKIEKVVEECLECRLVGINDCILELNNFLIFTSYHGFMKKPLEYIDNTDIEANQIKESGLAKINKAIERLNQLSGNSSGLDNSTRKPKSALRRNRITKV